MMDLLYKLNAQRWDWATKGIAEFRNGFLGLKETVIEKQRVMIGVYGPTQVGKTTLILKILGIKDIYLAPLSNALRGSRAVGNSATVTSTNYQQSDDDTFQVHFPNGVIRTCQELIQLEAVMSDLRVAVESSHEYPTLLLRFA